RNSYRYINRYSNGNAHGNSDSYCNSNAYTVRDSYYCSNGYTDRSTHRHTNTNTDGNTPNPCGYSNADPNPNPHGTSGNLYSLSAYPRAALHTNPNSDICPQHARYISGLPYRFRSLSGLRKRDTPDAAIPNNSTRNLASSTLGPGSQRTYRHFGRRLGH